jgi:hypothetical protein
MNIIFIIVFAFVVRLISLSQSLWMDEAISATVVKNFDLGGIVNKFALGDTHPSLILFDSKTVDKPVWLQ